MFYLWPVFPGSGTRLSSQAMWMLCKSHEEVQCERCVACGPFVVGQALAHDCHHKQCESREKAQRENVWKRNMKDVLLVSFFGQPGIGTRLSSRAMWKSWESVMWKTCCLWFFFGQPGIGTWLSSQAMWKSCESAMWNTCCLWVLFWSARHWHMIVITSNVKVVWKRNVKVCVSATWKCVKAQRESCVKVQCEKLQRPVCDSHRGAHGCTHALTHTRSHIHTLTITRAHTCTNTHTGDGNAAWEREAPACRAL